MIMNISSGAADYSLFYQGVFVVNFDRNWVRGGDGKFGERGKEEERREWEEGEKGGKGRIK